MSQFSQRSYTSRPTYRGASRSSRPSPSTTQLPPDRDILEGFVRSPLQTLSRPEVDPAEQDVKVKDLEFIGSYNWIDQSKPTILVPGSPREWRDVATPLQVQADTGVVFVDQNSSRLPQASLLPLVTAVEMRNEAEDLPYFDWSSVDIITDRNGLRKLLRWIDDPEAKEFRIDTELAGQNTILFSRWDKRHKELMSGYTYGFNFEKASTMPAEGCAGSSSHHRIVSYDLSGLKIVIRFEVDACIPRPTLAPTRKAARKSTNIDDLDDLTAALSGIKLSSASSAPSSNAEPAPGLGNDGKPLLHVKKGGSWSVKQDSLVEMTTRSQARQALDWVDAYPQLFLSQTQNHYLGVHNRGIFTSVLKRKLGSPEMASVERKAQPSLRKLVSTLKTIQKIVLRAGSKGRLSFVFRNGELSVYKRTSHESFLPSDIMTVFDGRN